MTKTIPYKNARILIESDNRHYTIIIGGGVVEVGRADNAEEKAKESVDRRYAG